MSSDDSLIATQMAQFIKRHLQDRPLIALSTKVTSLGLRLLIASLSKYGPEGFIAWKSTAPLS